MERFGEFRLGHSAALPQHLDARQSAHLWQFLGDERFRIRVRQRCGYDLHQS